MFSFLLKYLTAIREKGIWSNENQRLHGRRGMWTSSVQRKGLLATGLEEPVTYHAGCCAFLFRGGYWGPQRAPKAVTGTQGSGASKSDSQAGCTCVSFPVWGGKTEPQPDRGPLPEHLRSVLWTTSSFLGSCCLGQQIL